MTCANYILLATGTLARRAKYAAVVVLLVVSLVACGDHPKPRPAANVGACAYLDNWTSANGHAPPASFVAGYVDSFTGLNRAAVAAEINTNCPRYGPVG